MISLVGFHKDWELRVYGVFSEYTFTYPELLLDKGLLDIDLMKERLNISDRLNPFYYTSSHLIARVETNKDIQLFKVSTELEIRVNYLLRRDSIAIAPPPLEETKTIQAKANVCSFISIDKGRLDVNQRVFNGIRELLRPPTLILHEGNTLAFTDGNYIPLERNIQEDNP